MLRATIVLILLLLIPWQQARRRLLPPYPRAAHRSHLAGFLRALLLKHYPELTPADLERARAYAYAGSVIQDMATIRSATSCFPT